MNVFIVYFAPDNTGFWERLLNVFLHSLRKYKHNVLVRKISKPDYVPGKGAGLTYNTKKLELWCDYAQRAEDNTIFIDADMLCLADPARVFDQEFDIGITNSPGQSPPLNAGVVFFKPTAKGRQFFREWLVINNQMYKDEYFRQQWATKYLGMNQAALGCMIETGLTDGVKYLPQQKWNLTDQLWRKLDGETVFVHIKGQLRVALMNRANPAGDLRNPMQLWYQMEKESGLDTPPLKPMPSKHLTGRRYMPRGRTR